MMSTAKDVCDKCHEKPKFFNFETTSKSGTFPTFHPASLLLASPPPQQLSARNIEMFGDHLRRLEALMDMLGANPPELSIKNAGPMVDPTLTLTPAPSSGPIQTPSHGLTDQSILWHGVTVVLTLLAVIMVMALTHTRRVVSRRKGGKDDDQEGTEPLSEVTSAPDDIHLMQSRCEKRAKKLSWTHKDLPYATRRGTLCGVPSDIDLPTLPSLHDLYEIEHDEDINTVKVKTTPPAVAVTILPSPVPARKSGRIMASASSKVVSVGPKPNAPTWKGR